MKEGYYCCTAFPYDIFKVNEFGDIRAFYSNYSSEDETSTCGWAPVRMSSAYIGAQWVPIEDLGTLGLLNIIFSKED